MRIVSLAQSRVKNKGAAAMGSALLPVHSVKEGQRRANESTTG